MEPSTEDSQKDEDEDEWICKGSGDDSLFDTTIGHIEDIIIGPEFALLQNDFMEKYYKSFEEIEENKLEYMDIFNEYTEHIEKYIEEALTRRIPGFLMKDFLCQIERKREELDGEIFDILLSFTDFIAFKEMILDYKAVKEGRTPNLFLGQDPEKICKGEA